jgi:hypothetical protein
MRLSIGILRAIRKASILWYMHPVHIMTRISVSIFIPPTNLTKTPQDLYYSADGGEDIRRDVALGNEPYIPHVEALVNRGPAISVYSYWQLNIRKLAAQKAYLDKWNATRGPVSGRVVDVLLMPTAPHSAVPHRKSK